MGDMWQIELTLPFSYITQNEKQIQNLNIGSDLIKHRVLPKEGMRFSKLHLQKKKYTLRTQTRDSINKLGIYDQRIRIQNNLKEMF